VRTCGELAALSAEAAEVRFGNEGVRLWRLARGDGPRIIFRPIPPEQPYASLDFVDYTVRDATRLVFTLNALLDQVCGMMLERARRTRRITITFTLAGGGEAKEVLRTARATADRTVWVRRLRSALEVIKLPDAIAGVALEAGSLESISSLQGDLFDRGFATATFVEEAVGRLLDLYRGLFTRQISSAHPLAERRARWTDLTPEEAVETEGGGKADAPGLQLQLLNEPKPIRVRTRTRRDHVLPLRYQEGKEWLDLIAAGPDRISGAHEERRPYAREYYRCASGSGALLWIYRDAVEDRWYLHGWWD
jgi:protein ImuB